jgi:hypothetical protein
MMKADGTIGEMAARRGLTARARSRKLMRVAEEEDLAGVAENPVDKTVPGWRS